MFRLRLIISAMIFAVSGYTTCADTLTLETARSLALVNSRTLASYTIATQIANIDEKQQFYETLPTLSLSSSLSSSVTKEKNLADSLSAGVTVGASQTIWSGGKSSILSSINLLATESARIQARAAYFTVLDDIDTAWYEMLEANAALVASESAISAAEVSLSIADVRLETGAISMIDHLEAESALDSARATLSQARRNAAIARIKVASLAGLESVGDVSEAEIGEYGNLISRVSQYSDSDIERFVSSLLTAANAGNATMLLLEIENSKAAESVKLASAEYLPSITASVSTGLNRVVFSGESNSSLSVSLGGSVPLDWWKTRVAVKNAELSAKQTVLAGEESSRTLDIDIRSAAYDCVSLARSVISGEKALEYARKLYEAKLELYRLGSASVSDLSDAASLVSTNEVQLISARYGFLECLSTLRTLSGVENEAGVREIMP
jgi:outer membrane protein